MGIILGCIADDLTGASDLALVLVKNGMRTIQISGIPDSDMLIPDVDVVVIALKSRTCPVNEAVDSSLAACDWLLQAGARQIFFKYCSTFDSTDKGNIGPVADALLAKTKARSAIACPAFPANGRSVYNGHLFVNHQLLSESSLKDHPLTPMNDPNLVRVLSRQSNSQVSLIPYSIVEKGALAISDELAKAEAESPALIIIDALNDTHLLSIADALDKASLITGGSAVAQGLPALYEKQGWLEKTNDAASVSYPAGAAAILAGSCSEATREQIKNAEGCFSMKRISVDDILADDDFVSKAVAWAQGELKNGNTVLIYSSDAPENLAEIQKKHGKEQTGEMIENTLAQIALHLKNLGVRRFIVAGGETSGAVVNALNLRALEIVSEIDPGVPWTVSVQEKPIAIAMKSGNFGSPEFFVKALNMLEDKQVT